MEKEKIFCPVEDELCPYASKWDEENECVYCRMKEMDGSHPIDHCDFYQFYCDEGE